MKRFYLILLVCATQSKVVSSFLQTPAKIFSVALRSSSLTLRIAKDRKDYIIPRTFSSSFPSPDNPTRDGNKQKNSINVLSPQQIQHIQEQIKYLDEKNNKETIKKEESNGEEPSKPKVQVKTSTLSYLSSLASLNTTHSIPALPSITFSSLSPEEVTPYSSFYNEVITNEMPNSKKTLQIQGGALKTCRMDESVDRLSIKLSTHGNQLTADLYLWDGPNECPQSISVYLENGKLHPFYASIENADTASVIAVRNKGQITFPLNAEHVFHSNPDDSKNITMHSPAHALASSHKNSYVQRGGTFTAKFTDFDDWVEVAILNDGRPMNAKIELMNGPYDIRESIELNIQDGQRYPFFTVLQIHGDCSLRIMNTATADFPFRVAVVSHSASRMRSHHQI